MNAEYQQWQELKQNYLKYVEQALASVDSPNTTEILNDVAAHLENKYADLPPEHRTWEAFQQIITEMGPPQEYAELLSEDTPAAKKATLGINEFLAVVFVIVLMIIGGYLIYTAKKTPAPAPALVTKPVEFELDERVLGKWVTVDFIRHIDDFDPAQKSWPGDLFLNSLVFKQDGILLCSNAKVESYKRRWTKGKANPDHERPAFYYLRNIEGQTYLFYEWVSGDVTLRGREPAYYVLKQKSEDNVKSEDANTTNLSVTAGPQKSPEEIRSSVISAVENNHIAYKLTTPEELETITGSPSKESQRNDGDMEILTLEYPSGIWAQFTRMKGKSNLFTLQFLKVNGRHIELNEVIVLRNENDLSKFDTFWGFSGVSLAKVDLTNHLELLETMPYDTRTLWPEQEKLPNGFDPIKLIEDGKYPGLGIRTVHEQGIQGQGISIAILDQPLLKEHLEYKDQLRDYKILDSRARFVGPQMHGPPVCSIAVGKDCGVAPKADLYYFAYPSWIWGFEDCKPYCKAIETIIQYNSKLEPNQKIRVISHSFGGFSQMPNYDQWQEAIKKANDKGILVVNCDPDFLKICTLRHKDGQGWDKPECFEPGRYRHRNFEVGVPAGNRTVAGHQGVDVYTFYREGGMSWSVPYLAGLGALAFQVNPEIEPVQIIELWKETAHQTEFGPVINPTRFIEQVRKIKKAGQ